MGWFRRSIAIQRTPGIEVEAAVQAEITGGGQNVARREGVRQLLLRLDPEGIERRKSRKFWLRIYRTLGPNYVSHMVNSNPVGSVLTGAWTDIQGEYYFVGSFCV